MKLSPPRRVTGGVRCALIGLIGALATAAVLLAATSPAQAHRFVFVANEHSADVSQYAAGAGGMLSPLTPPTVAAGSVPYGLAVTPDGGSAYVVNIAGNTVSQYNIDPVSGRLSPKTPPAVAAGAGPRGIAVTPDGKSAYVTNGYTNADTVSQYDIDPVTGRLSPKTPATVPAGSAPLGVAVTPDGRSAYVTNQFGDNVSQYDIDPVSGALSPKTPPTAAGGFSPREMAVSPDGKSAYMANASGIGVSQYDIDPVSGALSPKNPGMVDAGAGPNDVAVAPDGRSAYVTNSASGHGHNVSQYDIDPTSGALSPKTPASVATGTGPFFVDLTPDGKSAYITNFQVNTVSQYNVDPVSGRLSPKTPATVATGTQPTGIAVAATPAKIAFASTRTGNGDIYSMSDTAKTRLTTNPALDGFPASSANRKKIAFASNRTATSRSTR